ncbi:MAG: 2-phospho-L-lactate transferase [Chloroflexota bacterium]|nr:2-phospho-L-lactate transferase [Chloroflexota bacterium]
MKITALAGGVGGSKLAQGLSEVLAPEDLKIIVNTGDDFRFFGLYISPDIDTVTYTLANLSNPKTGWGVRDETFNTFEMLKSNGSPAWFMLGDKDLATHMERTRQLDEGKTLTDVCAFFKQAWQVKHPILPMTNDPVPTCIDTIEQGLLPFQEYFAKYHCEPTVKDVVFQGMNKAKPTPEVLDALENCDAVVICPSNPLLSIDPILSLPGIRELLKSKYVVAVSPIIGGKAVKGPLAKMYTEKGVTPSPATIAEHYKEFLDCIYIDDQDLNYGKDIQQSGIIFQSTDIMMPDLSNRIRLADTIIEYLEKI